MAGVETVAKVDECLSQGGSLSHTEGLWFLVKYYTFVFLAKSDNSDSLFSCWH